MVNHKPTCLRVNYSRMAEKLHDFVDIVNFNDRMKKARIAKDPQLDKVVFTWFVKERQAVAKF